MKRNKMKRTEQHNNSTPCVLGAEADSKLPPLLLLLLTADAGMMLNVFCSGCSSLWKTESITKHNANRHHQNVYNGIREENTTGGSWEKKWNLTVASIRFQKQARKTNDTGESGKKNILSVALVEELPGVAVPVRQYLMQDQIAMATGVVDHSAFQQKDTPTSQNAPDKNENQKAHAPKNTTPCHNQTDAPSEGPDGGQIHSS
jgi:hypothetical protein